MRSTLVMFGIAAGLVLAGAAHAITRGSVTVAGSGSQQSITDPDEGTQRMVDQTRRASTRGAYDRDSARSVMEHQGSVGAGPPPR